MLKTQYRQPIDWTLRTLEEAATNLNSLNAVWEFPNAEADRVESRRVYDEVLDCINDDLNTVRAIGLLIENSTALLPEQLNDLLKLLGFDFKAMQITSLLKVDRARVVCLVEDRLVARHTKNWAESDRIRDELAAMGIAIKDNKDGTTTWEVKR